MDADIAVIGVGALGLSTALHCAMSGRPVATFADWAGTPLTVARSDGSGFSSSLALGEALATWITGGTPPPGLTALAPGRFGPVLDDTLLSPGLWQYAHYYDPITMTGIASSPSRS